MKNRGQGSEFQGGLAGLAAREHLDPQPAPVPNARPAVWGLVIADMHARDAQGRERYGTPLQPFNGRDPLVDAYQEALDLCVYLRQAIAERDERDAAHNAAFDAALARARENIANIGRGPYDPELVALARQVVAGDAPPVPAGGHPVFCHASDPTTAYARCTLMPGHPGAHRVGVREWPQPCGAVDPSEPLRECMEPKGHAGSHAVGPSVWP